MSKGGLATQTSIKVKNPTKFVLTSILTFHRHRHRHGHGHGHNLCLFMCRICVGNKMKTCTQILYSDFVRK